MKTIDCGLSKKMEEHLEHIEYLKNKFSNVLGIPKNRINNQKPQ